MARGACHTPWWLAAWDEGCFGAEAQTLNREQVEVLRGDYMVREAAAHGTAFSAIARHMLGLRHGLAGSRRWRQVWSDHQLKDSHPRDVMALAHDAVARVA